MLPATIVQWGWCYLAVAFRPNREALDNDAPGLQAQKRGERKSQHSTRPSFLDRPGRPGFMPSDAGLVPPVFEKTRNGQAERAPTKGPEAASNSCKPGAQTTEGCRGGRIVDNAGTGRRSSSSREPSCPRGQLPQLPPSGALNNGSWCCLGAESSL